MFRSEKTVPKTSFASSSLERPFRAGRLLSPLPAVRPIATDATSLDCGRVPAEEGLLLLLVLVMLEVVFEALLLEACNQRLEYMHSAVILANGDY